jgi:hypothetical protein
LREELQRLYGCALLENTAKPFDARVAFLERVFDFDSGFTHPKIPKLASAHVSFKRCLIYASRRGSGTFSSILPGWKRDLPLCGTLQHVHSHFLYPCEH